MSFTEKQYKEIVDIQKDRTNTTFENVTNDVIAYLAESDKYFSVIERWQALAIANPSTREYALENYVEKEKKYLWKLNGNAVNKSGETWFLDGNYTIDQALFTEEEIDASPFKKEFLVQVDDR